MHGFNRWRVASTGCLFPLRNLEATEQHERTSVREQTGAGPQLDRGRRIRPLESVVGLGILRRVAANAVEADFGGLAPSGERREPSPAPEQRRRDKLALDALVP